MFTDQVYLEVEKKKSDVLVWNTRHILSRVVSLVRAITLIVPHYEPLIQVIGLRLSKKVSLALCENQRLPRSPHIILLNSEQAAQQTPLVFLVWWTYFPCRFFSVKVEVSDVTTRSLRDSLSFVLSDTQTP